MAAKNTVLKMAMSEMELGSVMLIMLRSQMQPVFNVTVSLTLS